MAPKSSLTLFVFLILAVTGKSLPHGDWRPIENPNNSYEVVRAAQFAVADHNRVAQTQLVFKTVEEAVWQPIDGTHRFQFVISAMDGAAAAAPPKNYTAIVSEIVEDLSLHLISFH
ncbi:hypothetical protein C2S51_019865 [Perilla frutescens var. frutescens]|nr:hypothetical protein C2S51_019865 [Perilla frutescens var. frutescens]